MNGKMKKMDPEAKSVWVKALRSNKYTQCRGSLALQNSDGTDSYCALGVLANELGTGDWELTPSLGRTKIRWQYVQEDGVSSLENLPAEFVGLIGKEEHDTIMVMNDGMGKSFAEIADWIERNL